MVEAFELIIRVDAFFDPKTSPNQISNKSRVKEILNNIYKHLQKYIGILSIKTTPSAIRFGRPRLPKVSHLYQ